MKIAFALLIVILLVASFSHVVRHAAPAVARAPLGQVVFSDHPEAGLANQIIAYEIGDHR